MSTYTASFPPLWDTKRNRPAKKHAAWHVIRKDGAHFVSTKSPLRCMCDVMQPGDKFVVNREGRISTYSLQDVREALSALAEWNSRH